MGLLASLIPVLGPILDRALSSLIPDPAARQKFVSDLFGQLMQADLSQIEVNKAEAASASLFVAGWRPFIGWVCGSALAYQYLVVPLGLWIADMAGVAVGRPPTLDTALWELMFGMLGMGALRSLEKLKGVASR